MDNLTIMDWFLLIWLVSFVIFLLLYACVYCRRLYYQHLLKKLQKENDRLNNIVKRRKIEKAFGKYSDN